MARICMIAYTHYPTDSRVRREAEALIERGDSVDVICLGNKGGAAIEVLNGVRMVKILIDRYRGSSTINYLLSYLTFFFTVLFKLAKLQKENGYQVIQVHTMPDFMVFTALIPKLRGIKVLLDVHDLMPELYQSKFGYKATHPIIRLITWAERLSIKFADRAMAVHKPHLQVLCSHGNPAEKFTILLNLPDMKIFPRGDFSQPRDGSKLELIYHGTVARRNGLETAIRAIASLKGDMGDIDDLTLRIIGDGDEILHLIDLVKELGLEDRVKIDKGMKPPEQLIPFIMNADVGIVPIFYDDFTKYMLPVKLLEYVMMGKPVICSRTETIQEYFSAEMVYFISPGSVSDLAAAIRFLYEHPEKRLDLVKNSEKFNQTYSWEKQKQAYYQVIDSLIKK